LKEKEMTRRIALLLLIFCSVSLCKVVRLLAPDASGRKLVAAAEGLETLRRYEGPVAIVTFIGRARSGKSFGLNSLLNVSHAQGFEVGHTYKPETSGALLWSEPFPGNSTAPRRATVLVVDTEGLGAGAQVFDKPMLAVTSAISSRLVYHMMGYVYTEDVTRLHGLACLAEDYQRRGILGEVELPHITWLVNKNDLKKARPDQSDLDALFDAPLAERANADGNAMIAQFNATVRVVRSAFTEHVAHLVPSAAPPGVDCATLTERALDDLAPGYLRVMEQLRAEIAAAAPRMTGPQAAALVEAVLPAANEGLERVGDHMADAIARRRVADAKLAFADVVASMRYPMEERELDARLTVLTRDARGEFLGRRARSAPAAPLAALLERYALELEEKFIAEGMRARMLNSDASDAACAKAAAAASELFSRARLTAMGAARMDLGAFDVAVANAMAKYDAAAVGPRARFHADQLIAKARDARDAAIAETAPRRYVAWTVGCGVVAVLCWLAGACAGQFAWFAPVRVACAAVEGVRNLAVVVGMFALAAYLGFDSLGPLTFEAIAWFLTAAYAAAASHGATAAAACAGLVCAAAIAVALGRLRR